MNGWAKCIVVVVVAGLLALHVRADGTEEQLIQVLQSDAPSPAKDVACQKLKVVGTSKSVEALAGLLADPVLSHSARYALESMAAPEAAAALREGLGKTDGLMTAGIIDSLGQRRDKQSVDALKELVRDDDEQVAAAAVTALGRIGGAEAVGALRAARSGGRASIEPLVLDAMLACADGILAGGFRQDAVRVYREVHNADGAPEAARTAAYRGLILAAGDEGMGLVEKALNGTDRADILASLRLVPEMQGDDVTAALCSLLPKVRPELQVAMIQGLVQRGNATAAPAVAALAQDRAQPAAVRTAALRALGTLGDGSVVPLLSGIAAANEGEMQDAARQALVWLKGDGVREAMVERIGNSESAERVELIQALGRRHERGAAGVLMELTEDADEAVRAAAFGSLALVGDDSLIPPLVRIVARAEAAERRAAAERALRAIAARAEDVEQAVRSMALGLAVADPAAAAALLRAIAPMPAPQALAALREGTRSLDPGVSDAAVRAMAASSYAPAAHELVAIARDRSRSDAQRAIALRGCVRLVDEAGATMPKTHRVMLLKEALAAAERAEERRLALSALARVPDVSALLAAETALADKTVAEEAALACLQIARAVSKSNPAEARAACENIMASGAGEKVMAEAKALRDQIGR